MSENALPTLWDAPEVEEFDGGTTVIQKSDLVGKPFIIGNLAFRKGDFGPYVTLTAVDKDNNMFVVNDGSTGVYRQMVKWLHEKGQLDAGIDKPESQEYEVRILCKSGLRRSDYEGPGGKPSVTYYVA
jgi:hypothetical protein